MQSANHSLTHRNLTLACAPLLFLWLAHGDRHLNTSHLRSPLGRDWNRPTGSSSGTSNPSRIWAQLVDGTVQSHQCQQVPSARASGASAARRLNHNRRFFLVNLHSCLHIAQTRLVTCVRARVRVKLRAHQQQRLVAKQASIGLWLQQPCAVAKQRRWWTWIFARTTFIPFRPREATPS